MTTFSSSGPALGRRRTATPVALAGTNSAAREELANALSQIPEPRVEVLDLKSGKGVESPPAIVILPLGDDERLWATEIQEVRQKAPNSAVIGAISARSGGKVRQALRAGADDVLFLPVDLSDLSRCLVRLCETVRGGRSHTSTVCSIASVAGGVGVSSLSLALGFALSRQEDKRVALIDLGLQCGTLAAMLDLTPEHTIGELSDPSARIDSLRLESLLVAHKSGLYLLAAPQRIEESEIVSVAAITSLLEVMRELFDFVLIDCGHHMNETLLAAWEQSTHLFYVVEQSVSSVRPAQRFLEMFERLQLNGLDLQFVLNRYDPESPFGDAKIASVLRQPMAARIPRDDDTFLQFQLECSDLARLAPKSASRVAIDQLATHLSGIRAAPAPEAHPFFSRIRAALRPAAGGLSNSLPDGNFGPAIKPIADI